ncbi:MAG: GNAT family N-acetyltransferase [Xanthomonadales bacterium]|nr:GNAT family N-acetyltransferase [Xanthomonadales bacterium]
MKGRVLFWVRDAQLPTGANRCNVLSCHCGRCRPPAAQCGALPVRIEVDDLSRPAVVALLAEHLQSMHALSPPGSVHALNLDGLRSGGVTFWTAWDDGGLAGCAALKELSPTHGEIKSMRTPALRRRLGAGRTLLAHLIEEAHRRGYHRLSLETGSTPAFAAAHRLYEAFGFVACGPFGDYREDPHSLFMSRSLVGDRTGAASAGSD